MAYRLIQKPLQLRLRPRERQVMLFAGDGIMALLALGMALFSWAQGDEWLGFSITFLQERPEWWFYILPLIWLVLLIDIYDIRRAGRTADTFRGIAIAAGMSLGIYLLIFFLAPPQLLPRRGVAVFFVAAALLTTLWRLFYIRVFTAPAFTRRALIVGAGRSGTVLAAILNQSWPPPFHVVGFIDDDPEKLSMTIEGFSVLGDHSKIFEVVENEHVSDIIISISGQIDARTFEMLTLAEEQGIEVTTMPVVYEELLGRVPVYLLQSDWILRTFFDQAHTEGVFETLKRLIDILGGIIGMLILLPILPLIALVIFIDSGAPIFYSQVRLGQRGKPYRILKFRTMRQDAEKDGLAKAAVKDDDRVTRVGKILRKSHLDELPQFINILRGDMSLVGPRAERPEIVDEYQKNIPFYRGRLLVRPGLTGWAQVNYGYASNVEQNAIKLEYDLYYIMHRNLSLDFTIMLRTVGTVIGFRGQ